MKKSSYLWNLISRNSVVLIASIFFISTAFGQSNLAPVPANVKVGVTPNCPVSITVNGVEKRSSTNAPLNFSIRNASAKSIRALVVTGAPGTASTSTFFPYPFLPEKIETFNSGNTKWKNGSGEWFVSADFVLFNDGTTWGPDLSGQSDYLIGLFDGKKAVLADAKAFLEKRDEKALADWLKPGLDRTTQSPERNLQSRRERAYTEGYRQGLFVLKKGYDRNGLAGIATGIEIIEIR